MKKTILTLAILGAISLSGLQASAHHRSIDVMSNPGLNQKVLPMPYSTMKKASMEMIAKKGQYALYRCQDSVVDKYPGQALTGKTWHYFVYKNNKLHLSVTENNKKDIYKYFVG